MRLPALLCCLFPVFAAAAEPTLHPFRAEYEVLRNGAPLGRGVVTLESLGDGRWDYRSHTEGTRGLAGLAGAEIDERSQLRLAGGRLETIDYRYRQSLGWKTRERRVQVDAAGGKIVSRDRDRRYDFDYVPGVLDRQAVVLALGLDLSAGVPGDLRYVVADRDEREAQRYGVRGEETLQTRAGPKRTLRVERVRAGARARTTTSWLCPEEGYLPVRVLQTEPDGDTFEMRLVSLQR